ncbi:hypothetical protein DFH29DRAFT_1080338 [Suillus ampliporus]|nr:hypothetical protein DFH29DRAFT_1080338 [Suillus ampliporus]
MSSQNGGYDQNLLDEAPAATRAQRQEGYNVDLLDDRPNRTTSTQPLQPPPPQITPTDVESNSQEKFVPGAAAHVSSHPTQSFWRSRKGIITIFVIAVVVLGAVIGGAVGGTVGKHSSANNNAVTSPAGQVPNPSSSPVSTASAAVGSGAAAAASSSPTSSSSTDTTFSTTSPTFPSFTSTGSLGTDADVLYGNRS